MKYFFLKREERAYVVVEDGENALSLLLKGYSLFAHSLNYFIYQ